VASHDELERWIEHLDDHGVRIHRFTTCRTDGLSSFATLTTSNSSFSRSRRISGSTSADAEPALWDRSTGAGSARSVTWGCWRRCRPDRRIGRALGLRSGAHHDGVE
jgi:hypothetical protein